MGIFRMILMIAAALLSSSYAIAGTQTGTVTNLIVRDHDALVYVHLSGTPSGRPACAAGTVYWIIPDETTDTGKRMYASLLAAQMAGRTVIIQGKGTCTRWYDGEDINVVLTQ